MKKLIVGIIVMMLIGCGGGGSSVDKAISQVDKIIEKIEKKKGNLTEEEWKSLEKEAEAPLKVISDAIENDKVGAITKLKLIGVAAKWATAISQAGLIEMSKRSDEFLKEIDKAKEELEKAAGTNTSESDGNVNANSSRQQSGSDLDMIYAQSDFVPGNEIIFNDNQANENIRDFPSKWDLLGGSAEIASVRSEKAILFTEQTEITPLMKTQKNYLPEIFTLELDFYVPSQEVQGWWEFRLKEKEGDIDVVKFDWRMQGEERKIETVWLSTSDEYRRAEAAIDLSKEGWHRLSLSFNQRALKIYVDGVRVANIPNATQPGWFTARSCENDQKSFLIRNIRIAKG